MIKLNNNSIHLFVASFLINSNYYINYFFYKISFIFISIFLAYYYLIKLQFKRVYNIINIIFYARYI